VAVFTRRGPGKRGPNEDAAALLEVGEGRGVLAVADGCGGMDAGEEAARLAVTELERAVGAAVSRDSDTDLRGPILEGIEVADRRIRGLGVGAGTTLSVVGYAVEAGLLDEDEALHHEDLYVVANILGSENMHVEVGRQRHLAARDTVVVGSDGLFDNLYLEEIVERARRGRLDVAARRLLADCMRRMTRAIQPGLPPDPIPDPGKPDDLTFLLFRPGR
jgi:serine/threonine protein phosphatase PrpC